MNRHHHEAMTIGVAEVAIGAGALLLNYVRVKIADRRIRKERDE